MLLFLYLDLFLFIYSLFRRGYGHNKTDRKLPSSISCSKTIALHYEFMLASVCIRSILGRAQIFGNLYLFRP